jgi:hypothetical protein
MRSRRLRHIASVVLLTATFWLPATMSPASVQAVSSCTGWSDNTTPPSTIRVLRTSSGVVQTVDFQTYVKVVMAAEFSQSWPTEMLRVGAVVVKEYAWYYAMHYRGGTGTGGCYDIKDNSVDQVYQPESRTPAATQIAAVTNTWGEYLLRSGAIFLTGYRSGTSVACGSDADGYHLWQGSAYQCAKYGENSEYILHRYYDPIVIVGGPVIPGYPTGVTAVGYDRSVQVTWSAPASNGGATINLYTVTSTPDSKTCTTTGGLTCGIGGLANGQPYTFIVTAANSVGTGPPSDASLPITPAIVPGATYHPMTPPARLLDTRSGNGLTGKLLANTPRTFQVAGRDVIPGNATAVTGNVTVTGESYSWAIYLGPDSTSSPATSTLNFAKGDVTANGVTVALSPTGTLSATFMSTAGKTTDIVFDVTGYFTPDTTGATYHALTPARILDTRKNLGMTGTLSAKTPRTFTVWGKGGVPTTATAVTGNVTVVNSTNSWALYLGPTPLAAPPTSTINFSRRQVLANNLTVALSATGTLSATYLSTAGNTTDLVFDVTGYYTADLTGATYVPITPARMLDTRIGNGLSGKQAAGAPGTFQVSDRGRIPPGVIAVSGNVTVVNQTNSWAVFVGPNPDSAPSTSTINFGRGEVRANGLTVALSGTGTLSATYLSSAGNATDLVFDVTGYFQAPTT